MATPLSIPPSAGTREALKQQQQNGRRNKRNILPSRWLWLNAICLTVNLGLMLVLFVFHDNWGPSQVNNVIRSHVANRKEFFNLMRGKNQDGSLKNQQPGSKDNDADSNNNNKVELPYTLKNSPNSDDYLLSKQQYHIIFSTGCSAKQHWQSYMLFYSIATSGQLGQVTRIASGCTDEEAAELQTIHKEQIEPMGLKGNEHAPFSRFHLHMTPEFGSGFHYNNKPYGVAHWMENVLGYSETKESTNHDDTILFLLDPDMIMMRPFVNDFSKNEMWFPRTSYPNVNRIKHGFPMASVYLYGNQWYTKTNITEIVGKSPITSYTKEQINENYHAGPPYSATAKDFYRIVSTWRMLAQPVHEQYPYLLSEMFAYSLAAAHLELPHQLSRTFMVSDWKEPGLDLVTKNKDIKSEQMCGNVPTENKPHILHYCQRLALGKYLMSKYRLPEDFVGHPESCEKPLLKEPPSDVSLKYDYFIDLGSGKRQDIQDQANGHFTGQEKRDQAAFLLCEELHAFNRGGIYFKKNHCPAGKANMEKTFMFFDSTELTEEEKNQKGEIV